MRPAIAAVALLLCAGCVPFRATSVGPETFEISTPVSFMNPYNGAVITLDYRSRDVCPNGYTKLSERTTRIKGDEALFWTIRCR